ncbi:hypothetical protein P3G55_12510 [Leptospira sp. 96542]|nr:hypothetical protein [Leptospira sp. 96542]
MNLRLSVYFFLVLVLFLSCRTPLPEISSESIIAKKQIISIRWNTEDPILQKVFSEIFPVPPAIPLEENPQVANSLVKEKTFELSEINHLAVVIRSETQRPFYSIGVSLLALTMVYYGRMDTQAELIWNSNESNLHRISSLSTSETVWAPMPFYIGTGSSVVAPILSTNKYPSHIQKYCIEEFPTRLRETLEQPQSKNCQDYELYLRRLLLANYETIHPQLKEWEKRSSDWFKP